MKKPFFCFLLCFTLLSLTASSQTHAGKTTVTTLPVDSSDYLGKYKYENLPFEYMEITMKEGKLSYSGGEYSGTLNPVADKKDTFDANGEAVFTFVRNEQNKVIALKIDYQGETYTGQREEKKG